jgi:adenosylhomocysteine nucleosidase
MNASEESRTVSRVRALPRTCVLFALPQERKSFRPVASQDFRVSHSGAGAANAARAASAMLGAYDDAKPTIIVCGFGGALTPSMKPGDLFIAESVVDATEGIDYPRERLTPDSQLTTAALEQRITGGRVHKGALVTANRVLITSHEKMEWSRRTGAVAVDMETAGAALEANRSGAAWISIRAITDNSENDLPLDFNTLLGPDGNVNMLRFTMATVLRPWALPGLMRLNKSSALAGKNLAFFLESFLRRLPLSENTAEIGE